MNMTTSETEMQTRVWQAALAGLLFVPMRDSLIGNNLPTIATDAVKFTLRELVELADKLSVGKGEKGATEKSKPVETGLVPILARVSLLYYAPNPEGWRYRVGKLELSEDAVFPISREQEAASGKIYSDLWEKEMHSELDAWKKSAGWNELSLEAYFVTLLAFYRKYLSYVPSASPWQADKDDRVPPDVSLYDHLKVTAALAACLRAGFDDDSLASMATTYDKPIAMLVRGDWSGIQNFIYRIARADNERSYENVAKRLRGRSFYLGLLGDVIVDWVIRKLNLTPANIIYSGGGRFDLLVPIGCQARVQELEQEINAWLLSNYYGELDLRMACVEIKSSDVENMKDAYDAVETILIERKQQKWFGTLSSENFLKPKWEKHHACKVCSVTPLKDPGVCDECEKHLKIGSALPRTDYLVFAYGDVKGSGDVVTLPFDEFGVSVLLQSAKEIEALSTHAVIYRLNETNEFWSADASSLVGQSFRFMANAVPRALERIEFGGREAETIEKGTPLHFGAIAACSSGAQRIGILKADVDRLGLIFSLGVQPASLSRVSALSGAVDLFFAGWLNRMCDNVFEKWKEEQEKRAVKQLEANPLRGKVDGLFYVMYSGGDDLFIVGPWDATLALAEKLHDDFTRYACENPNLTLSAGYVQVKPHYPVQRFAELVDAALRQSKNPKTENGEGRNRITAFGETVAWSNAGTGFENLYKLAVKIQAQVEGKEIPRSLIHDLSQTEKVKSKATREEKPLFSPRLYYTLTRRLKEAQRDELLQEDAIKTLTHFAFIANYVSLSTRKE